MTYRAVTACALCLLPPLLFATDDRRPVELDPVIVVGDTDARSLPVAESPRARQVITRGEIARSQARDLTELLRLVAGVEIARLGGPGQQQSVFLRGQDSGATVITVDGVRINSALGGAAFQNIRPAMVERIEVVKGAAGAAWGPDAIGGVINIVTRRDVDTTSVRGAAGSQRTRDTGLLIGRPTENGHVQLGLDYFESDGIPTFETSEDRRGFRNTNLLTRFGTDLAGMQLDGTWLMQRGRTQFTQDGDSLDPRAQDFHNDVAIISLSERVGDVESKLSFSYVQDDLRQVEDAPNRTRTQRRSVEWINALPVDDVHELTLSAAYSTESLRFDGFTELDERRDFWRATIADRMRFGPHSLQLALGYIDDDAFGSKLTWSADYQWRVNAAFDLFAAAGTGVRAPTAFNRNPDAGGNPALRAEEARSVEGGVRVRPWRHLMAEARLFRIDTTDKIAGFPPENLGRARNDGIELTTRFRLYGFDTIAAAVWQDPRDVRSDEPLLRRARRTGTVRVDRAVGRSNIGAEVVASSSRRDVDAFDFSPTDVAGYAVVNLLASTRIGESVDLRLRVENIGNSEYQQVAGFRQPGRGYFAELEYRLF